MQDVSGHANQRVILIQIGLGNIFFYCKTCKDI